MWDIGMMLGLTKERRGQGWDSCSMFPGEGEDQLPEANTGGAISVVLHYLHRQPGHTLHHTIWKLCGMMGGVIIVKNLNT